MWSRATRVDETLERVEIFEQRIRWPYPIALPLAILLVPLVFVLYYFSS